MFCKNFFNFALHNRWSKIKHVKAVKDPQRASVSRKVSKEISVAVRLEGPDPANNIRLRLLIDKAKKMNIQKKVIENAIASGSGENGEVLVTQFFNCFGPYGIAILMICITDKFNRTSQELRKMVNEAGGSLGDASWAFQQRGVLVYDRNEKEEQILEMALGMDAIDVDIQETELIVYCNPPRLKEFESALGSPKEMEFVYYPIAPMSVENDEDYEKIETLLSELEEHPDVAHIYHNLEQRNSQNSRLKITSTLSINGVATSIPQLLTSSYKPIPVVIEKGLGANVWDVEGKKYLDFLSCYSAVNQGHCHPKIMDAMTKQLQNGLTLTSRAFYNNKFPLFAEFVCKYFGYESILPANSGAEAVEGAMKLARKWGYEKKGIPQDQAIILGCKENFHGRTISIVSMSTDPDSYGNFGPITPGFHQIDYNNVKALESFLEQHHKNVAAFLLEPIQGEAGVVVPDEGYLKKCFEICKKYNVLFISDEIQTGMGRTGALLAVDHEGVRADVVILGKAMSGGFYPVSCVLADRHIMDVIQPGQHGSTFAGNPLACAVAMEALQVIKDEKLVERSKELGDFLLKELKPLVRKDGVLTLVRGKGLFAALVVNHDFPGMDGHTAYDVCKLFKAQGLLAKQTHDTIIRLAPPLVITKEELTQGLNMIKKTLKGIESIGFNKYYDSISH